ncbi:DUF2939 domain-containing protein [Phenylobacterium sp.]|jgi:hypothetical protein|uniref:DUF2939 domain-containing protein n=1 Tax=Phenylobacterium sp. TaxID=1871053 RepID=UPI002E371F1B|nr:DUF2939 domain-containing protein [Phenylobacterium sp.]HEX2561783.1 DUF2939 domain-containing protein [Phenylobacterium sp.]
MPRVSTLLALAAALFALAFLAAPWFAFRALREAASARDAQALAELVDYPAVRASLKPQLTEAAAPGPPPDPWRDPIGALKRAMDPIRPAPPAVDRHLTPQGLHALTLAAPGAAPPPEARPPFPALDYWGFRRVRFAVHPKGAPSREVTFTFQRRGVFTWKLTHVDLPGESTAAVARGRPAG